MKRAVFLAFVVCWSACSPRNPPTGLQALQKEATWNQAREVYFHATNTPARRFKVDGEKGEIIDVHVYSTPQPGLVVVAFGETYHNTTGYEVHLALMKTNDLPAYPGNVYLCPVGCDFALDWLNGELSIFHAAGYYPDERDFKTGVVSKRRDFQYEKQVAGVTVKFIAADRATMDTKQAAMNARRLGR